MSLFAPRSAASGWRKQLLAALFLLVPQGAVQAEASPGEDPRRSAVFAGERASGDARRVADWVLASADNGGLPFMIVDKAGAKVFVFDASGTLQGAAPALLGLARGDTSPPGIGNRKLSTISPAERITPSGRFVAQLGLNLSGKDILWVDYDAAISLHRVVDSDPAERRPARLASASPLDNRVSYGCINVPVAFFERVVRTAFKATNGIVYVLPETKSVDAVFPVRSATEHASLAR